MAIDYSTKNPKKTCSICNRSKTIYSFNREEVDICKVCERELNSGNKKLRKCLQCEKEFISIEGKRICNMCKILSKRMDCTEKSYFWS